MEELLGSINARKSPKEIAILVIITPLFYYQITLMKSQTNNMMIEIRAITQTITTGTIS